MDNRWKEMVDFVIARAGEYIANEAKQGGKLEANAEYLASFRGNPYDNDATRAVVQSVLEERFFGKTQVKEPVRLICAGALGGFSRLDAWYKEGKDLPHKDMYNAGTTKSDFAAFKAALKDKELNNGLGYGGGDDEYFKIRALCSGLDQAIQGAYKHGYNVVADNTLAFTDSERDLICKQDWKDTVVVAIALSPEESARLNPKKQEEAKKTAKDFAASFDDLIAAVKDLTLYDSKGKLIYQQKDGEIKSASEADIASWKESCGAIDLEAYRSTPPHMEQPPRVGGIPPRS